MSSSYTREFRMLNAAYMGDLTEMKALLESKCDPNCKSTLYKNLTPLMRAAFNGRGEACQLLLDAKANVNDVTATDYSVLMFAIRSSQLHIVNNLLNANADVNKLNNAERTPLLEAVHVRCNRDVFQLLIDQHADLHYTTSEQHGALHVAAANGYALGVQKLLELKADVTQKDKYGSTPLMIAEMQREIISTGYATTIELLGGKRVPYRDSITFRRPAIQLSSSDEDD